MNLFDQDKKILRVANFSLAKKIIHYFSKFNIVLLYYFSSRFIYVFYLARSTLGLFGNPLYAINTVFFYFAVFLWLCALFIFVSLIAIVLRSKTTVAQ